MAVSVKEISSVTVTQEMNPENMNSRCGVRPLSSGLVPKTLSVKRIEGTGFFLITIPTNSSILSLFQRCAAKFQKAQIGIMR